MRFTAEYMERKLCSLFGTPSEVGEVVDAISKEFVDLDKDPLPFTEANGKVLHIAKQMGVPPNFVAACLFTYSHFYEFELPEELFNLYSSREDITYAAFIAAYYSTLTT